jgi:hypothetical protein
MVAMRQASSQVAGNPLEAVSPDAPLKLHWASRFRLAIDIGQIVNGDPNLLGGQKSWQNLSFFCRWAGTGCLHSSSEWLRRGLRCSSSQPSARRWPSGPSSYCCRNGISGFVGPRFKKSAGEPAATSASATEGRDLLAFAGEPRPPRVGGWGKAGRDGGSRTRTAEASRF